MDEEQRFGQAMGGQAIHGTAETCRFVKGRHHLPAIVDRDGTRWIRSRDAGAVLEKDGIGAFRGHVHGHRGRKGVVVVDAYGKVAGTASIDRFSHRGFLPPDGRGNEHQGHGKSVVFVHL